MAGYLLNFEKDVKNKISIKNNPLLLELYTLKSIKFKSSKGDK